MAVGGITPHDCQFSPDGRILRVLNSGSVPNDSIHPDDPVYSIVDKAPATFVTIDTHNGKIIDRYEFAAEAQAVGHFCVRGEDIVAASQKPDPKMGGRIFWRRGRKRLPGDSLPWSGEPFDRSLSQYSLRAAAVSFCHHASRGPENQLLEYGSHGTRKSFAHRKPGNLRAPSWNRGRQSPGPLLSVYQYRHVGSSPARRRNTRQRFASGDGGGCFYLTRRREAGLPWAFSVVKESNWRTSGLDDFVSEPYMRDWHFHYFGDLAMPWVASSHAHPRNLGFRTSVSHQRLPPVYRSNRQYPKPEHRRW